MVQKTNVFVSNITDNLVMRNNKENQCLGVKKSVNMDILKNRKYEKCATCENYEM